MKLKTLHLSVDMVVKLALNAIRFILQVMMTKSEWNGADVSYEAFPGKSKF